MQRWREVRKELGHRRRPGLGMEVVRGGDGASSYIRTKTPLTANGVDVLQHPQAPALPQRGRAEG